jgi:hypothetical protein
LEPAHYVEIDAVEIDLRVSQLAVVATDGKVGTKEQHTVVNGTTLRSLLHSRVEVVYRFGEAGRILAFGRGGNVGVIDSVSGNSPPTREDADSMSCPDELLRFALRA